MKKPPTRTSLIRVLIVVNKYRIACISGKSMANL